MELELPPKPTREALIELCATDPEKVADLLLLIWGKLEELAEIVEKQSLEIAELKTKLSKNSRNSSKPPSTDKSNSAGTPPKKKTVKKETENPEDKKDTRVQPLNKRRTLNTPLSLTPPGNATAEKTSPA